MWVNQSDAWPTCSYPIPNSNIVRKPVRDSSVSRHGLPGRGFCAVLADVFGDGGRGRAGLGDCVAEGGDLSLNPLLRIEGPSCQHRNPQHLRGPRDRNGTSPQIEPSRLRVWRDGDWGKMPEVLMGWKPKLRSVQVWRPAPQSGLQESATASVSATRDAPIRVP